MTDIYSNSAIRRAERRSRQQFVGNCLKAMLIMLILTIGAITLIRVNYIMKVQQDIADTLTQIQIDQSIDDEQKTTSQVNLEPQERELVARVVAAEARGEDLQGMMAVAQVILDRSVLWDMTPTEVVTAPDQFADPYQGEISDSVSLAVANVFDGGQRVYKEPITHFYSGPEPYWASGKQSRGSIGRHEFMY